MATVNFFRNSLGFIYYRALSFRPHGALEGYESYAQTLTLCQVAYCCIIQSASFRCRFMVRVQVLRCTITVNNMQ